MNSGIQRDCWYCFQISENTQKNHRIGIGKITEAYIRPSAGSSAGACMRPLSFRTNKGDFLLGRISLLIALLLVKRCLWTALRRRAIFNHPPYTYPKSGRGHSPQWGEDCPVHALVPANSLAHGILLEATTRGRSEPASTKKGTLELNLPSNS